MRAYIRWDPRIIEEKLKAGYSFGQVGAYCMLQSQAEQQPQRGRFKSMGLLKAAMDCMEEQAGAKARASLFIPFLLDQGDIVRLDDGTYYADGWDELQEGDHGPRERIDLVRNRRRGRPGDPDSPGARRQRRYRERLEPADQAPVNGPRPSQTAADSDVTIGTNGSGNCDERHVARDQDVSRKQKAEGISNSGGDASPGGDGDAATGAVQAPKRRTGPTMSPEAIELVQGYQDLGYAQPSATDCIKAEEFVGELLYLAIGEMVERMRGYLAWCEENGHPRPASLGAFWNSLRRENDHRRDQGARPRDRGGAPSAVAQQAVAAVLRVQQGGLS